jgi:hypothetical protein
MKRQAHRECPRVVHQSGSQSTTSTRKGYSERANRDKEVTGERRLSEPAPPSEYLPQAPGHYQKLRKQLIPTASSLRPLSVHGGGRLRSDPRLPRPSLTRARAEPQRHCRGRPNGWRARPRRRRGGLPRCCRWPRRGGWREAGPRPPGLPGRPPGQRLGLKLCNGSCGAWQITPSSGPRARPSWPVTGSAPDSRVASSRTKRVDVPDSSPWIAVSSTRIVSSSEDNGVLWTGKRARVSDSRRPPGRRRGTARLLNCRAPCRSASPCSAAAPRPGCR